MEIFDQKNRQLAVQKCFPFGMSLQANSNRSSSVKSRHFSLPVMAASIGIASTLDP
jgi:hypothetical protein